jgi:hypothetical protein
MFTEVLQSSIIVLQKLQHTQQQFGAVHLQSSFRKKEQLSHVITVGFLFPKRRRITISKPLEQVEAQDEVTGITLAMQFPLLHLVVPYVIHVRQNNSNNYLTRLSSRWVRKVPEIEPDHTIF